jgi:type III secretion system chaperone SycN
MSSLDAAVAELARRMGAGELTLGPSAPLGLEIASVGLITLELDPDGENLAVSLSWPLEPWDQTTLPRALELCSLEQSPELCLQAGLIGDKALLMTRRPAGDLDAPALESLILSLVKAWEGLKKP